MPERMISGLQLGLVDKTSLSTSDWVELLNGTYIAGSTNQVQEFRVLASTIPGVGSGQWFDLGPSPLSFERARFDIPAFVFLNYRFVAQKK